MTTPTGLGSNVRKVNFALRKKYIPSNLTPRSCSQNSSRGPHCFLVVCTTCPCEAWQGHAKIATSNTSTRVTFTRIAPIASSLSSHSDASHPGQLGASWCHSAMRNTHSMDHHNTTITLLFVAGDSCGEPAPRIHPSTLRWEGGDHLADVISHTNLSRNHINKPTYAETACGNCRTL